jgi:hypothetical protein
MTEPPETLITLRARLTRLTGTIEPIMGPAQARIEVLKGIRDGRFRHNQRIWVKPRTKPFVSDWFQAVPVSGLIHDCGTTACIGGWTALITAPPSTLICGAILTLGDAQISAGEYAQQALGLAELTAMTLFGEMDEPMALELLEHLAAHPEES